MNQIDGSLMGNGLTAAIGIPSIPNWIIYVALAFTVYRVASGR